MINEPFKVRAFGFGELAQLYFPNITKKSASWQLRTLKIEKNKTRVIVILSLQII